MPQVGYITHKGKKILFMDVRDNQDLEENKRIGNECRAIITAQPPGSVLLLTDVTYTRYDRETIDFVKEFSTRVTPYLKASAMVGVVSVRKIILDTLNRLSGRNIRTFEDLEKAKDWLAGQ